MNLIVYAVPFFILAILVELGYGVAAGRNTYRLNDSCGSLFLGVLSEARRFVTLGVGGYIYYLVTQYFSLPLMDASHWFTWVLAIVLYDLCYYWLHRLGHERTILWAAHVAHHQSEDYNLGTALRQTSTGFLLGWVFYIPMYMLGIPAEVVVTAGAINLIYQFWVHTEHIPKLGWYEWVFVTPSNHRVHHAQNEVYIDRNYAGIFILWDRLFGTFQEELDSEPVIFGIRGALRSWNPVKALTHIYIDMVNDSRHASRWQDKLRVWVGRTGWRPADVETCYPRDKTDLAHFEKYNPTVPAPVSWYGLFQLLFAVVLIFYMQWSEPGYWSGVGMWVMLLGTTVCAALWLEGRFTTMVLLCDLLRLGFWLMLLLGAWQSGHALAPLLVGLFYSALNLWLLLWLWRGKSTTVNEPVLEASVGSVQQ